MKKIIIIFLLFIFNLTVTLPTFAYTKGKAHVNSYTRKNGKHVKAHSKSVYRGKNAHKRKH